MTITCHGDVTCTLSHAPSLRLFFCDARIFFPEIFFSTFIYWGRVDGGRDRVLGDVRLDLPPRIRSKRTDVLCY